MKVLLVEDSRILRDRLRAIINGIPHAVLVAEVDNEGDAGYQMDKHRPDVAVLDLRLRSGSGLSVIEHIKAAHSATIMVVLTNLGQAEYRASCMELGAHYFFDKSKDIGPFTDLLVELGKVCAGRVGACRTSGA